MRIVRARLHGDIDYGEIDDNNIWPLTGPLHKLHRVVDCAPVPLANLQLLAPSVPSKIVAVGPNYRAHLRGGPAPPRPYLWIKPPSTLNDPEGTIWLPAVAPLVNHEPELAIVIAREVRNVNPEKALDAVLGYTCINDVTSGNMQEAAVFMASMEFVDGKIHDSFAPLGPWIETSLQTSNLRIRCRVNGELRQDHSTSDMIFPVEELISIVSSHITLFPGDVIATGSPPGIGRLENGDVVEVEVEGIGVLRNRVLREHD